MLPIHRAKGTVFNYDEIPPGYYYRAMMEGGATQRFWHRHKFAAVAERIGPQDHVLDVGCGPGSFLAILGELKPEVRGIGVDIASTQINFAQEQIGSQFSDGRIRFQGLPAGEVKLPFEDHSFDVVTSIEVIEHIHPHLASLLMAEARRVLRPGGKLVVTTPNYRSLWPFIEWMLEKMSPVKYHDQHISKFTPNALVKFLETTGFEVMGLDTIFLGAPFVAPLSQGLARTLHGVEKKLPGRLGSLLLAEALPLQWDGEDVGGK